MMNIMIGEQIGGRETEYEIRQKCNEIINTFG